MSMKCAAFQFPTLQRDMATKQLHLSIVKEGMVVVSIKVHSYVICSCSISWN